MDNEKIRIYTNYKRQHKLLGIIDYKSLVIFIIYVFIVISILRIIKFKLEISLYIFMFMTIPIFSLLLINSNNESAIDMLLIIFRYLIGKKIYINKEYEQNLKNEIYR